MKTSVKMDVDVRGRPSTTRNAQSGRRRPWKAQSGWRRQLEKLSLVDVDREKCSGVNIDCWQLTFIWLSTLLLLLTANIKACKNTSLLLYRHWPSTTKKSSVWLTWTSGKPQYVEQLSVVEGRRQAALFITPWKVIILHCQCRKRGNKGQENTRHHTTDIY